MNVIHQKMVSVLDVNSQETLLGERELRKIKIKQISEKESFIFHVEQGEGDLLEMAGTSCR